MDGSIWHNATKAKNLMFVLIHGKMSFNCLETDEDGSFLSLYVCFDVVVESIHSTRIIANVMAEKRKAIRSCIEWYIKAPNENPMTEPSVLDRNVID